MTLGERLQFLLAERDLKQNKFAKENHMSATTFNGYVKGNRQPDYDTLIKIAEYFDVSTDYLLGVTEFPHRLDLPLTVKEQNFMGVYRNLNQEKQDLLFEQAEFYQRPRKKEEGSPLKRIRNEEFRNGGGEK